MYILSDRGNKCISWTVFRKEREKKGFHITEMNKVVVFVQFLNQRQSRHSRLQNLAPVIASTQMNSAWAALCIVVHFYTNIVSFTTATKHPGSSTALVGGTNLQSLLKACEWSVNTLKVVHLATHGWHGNSRGRDGGILGLPLWGNGLYLSVELDALEERRDELQSRR